MKVVHEIAPSRKISIKTNMQEWFDSETAALIHAREKLFLKFKKSKLHTDEENYKKVKYRVQNLIRKKKIEFCENNLRQKINKPKELWKNLKVLGPKSGNSIPAGNYMFKVNNRNTRTRCEICSK